MRALVVTTVLFLSACSIRTASEEAAQAAHFSRAALEETKQLAGRVETLESNAAKAQAQSQIAQRQITKGLQDVAAILDRLAERLAATACIYPPLDDPRTRVP